MLRDPLMKEAYAEFMDRYLRLGHMKKLLPEELSTSQQRVNYLPSSRNMATKGWWSEAANRFQCLCVHPGPKLQNDLVAVITRWRRWLVAYSTDNEMMFRQILVNAEHTDLQRIICSASPEEPEVRFVLLTVIY